MVSTPQKNANKQINNKEQLLSYIESNYSEFEPIFAEDIEQVYADAESALEELCQKGELNKEYGLYCLGSGILPSTAARSRYLGRRGKTSGTMSI